MTTKKGIVLLFAITMIAFMILPAQGDWEIEQIESIYDDGFIAETGGSFFETSWVQIQGGSVNIASYFAFRGVTIPDNSTILNAYLEFTAPFPWNYNQTLIGTAYGIKTPDLTSWDPTPSLLSEPITDSFTNFDVAPLISGASINVTVTDQVKEIYGLFEWKSNNDMGFSVLTVAVSGGARYAEAYDNAPNRSAKLYVEYTASTETTQYYKGYRIVKSTVNTYGLDDPRFWIEKPITTQGSGITRHNVSTWDAWFLHNGIYGEVFDYVEPYKEGMFFTQQHDASFDILQVRSPLGSWGTLKDWGGYGTGVTFYMMGNVDGVDPINGNLGVLNVVGQSWAGTWLARNSNSRMAVGLLLTAINETYAELTPIGVFGVFSAVDSTVSHLKEDNYYLIKTEILNFQNYWLGSYYQYAYANDIFSLNVTTGEVIDLGRANIMFNSTDLATHMECFNLFVDYGSGASSDYVNHQMLRGWNAEISYDPYTVYDENGTRIGGFDTLDDAETAIDDIEGQSSDDPNPPGTTYPDDGVGELTRFNLRMYIWLIGWVLIFIPPLAMAYKSYPFQFYLVFFIIEVLGWALLWSIASI